MVILRSFEAAPRIDVGRDSKPAFIVLSGVEGCFGQGGFSQLLWLATVGNMGYVLHVVSCPFSLPAKVARRAFF